MGAKLDPKSAKFCSGRHRVWKSARNWVPRVPTPSPEMSQRSQKTRSRTPRSRRGGPGVKISCFCPHFASILVSFWTKFWRKLGFLWQGFWYLCRDPESSMNQDTKISLLWYPEASEKGCRIWRQPSHTQQ